VKTLRKLLLTLIAAGLMLVMMAAPALAHIHVTIPAGDCATSDQAANNQTAKNAILFKNPEKDPPLGPAGTSPAPDDCPAPQK
jgi:hypothetical protein